MKKIIMICVLAVTAFTVKAQDTVKTTSDAPLVIFGSADAYYKYDFSGHNNIALPAGGSYYGNDQNSFSIGMIDFGFKKKVGKAAFVGELSFGPRSDASL
ncbi:porin, partial [Mucilaginibacter sp. UR6-11]|uniref:porin n=1 Tax=Mucilaginibacter sp. UR6-11 TaxID=1435644 RepID=UPI001E5A614E|nr:porin [Mucilaginibacter sp. UR6-11]